MRAVGAPQLVGKQVILDDQVGELAAQIGAVRIQHQRRLVGLLGARVRALDLGDGRERPPPQCLALDAVTTVERGERPLAQLAQGGGPVRPSALACAAACKCASICRSSSCRRWWIVRAPTSSVARTTAMPAPERNHRR